MHQQRLSSARSVSSSHQYSRPFLPAAPIATRGWFAVAIVYILLRWFLLQFVALVVLLLIVALSAQWR